MCHICTHTPNTGSSTSPIPHGSSGVVVVGTSLVGAGALVVGSGGSEVVVVGVTAVVSKVVVTGVVSGAVGVGEAGGSGGSEGTGTSTGGTVITRVMLVGGVTEVAGEGVVRLGNSVVLTGTGFEDVTTVAPTTTAAAPKNAVEDFITSVAGLPCCWEAGTPARYRR